MNRSFVIVSLITLLVSCKGAQETTTSTVTTSTSTTATQVSTTTAAPTPAPTATQAPTAAAQPAPAGTSLASQETNWPGITAEVTEFRRRGNTMTAKVRLTNKGTEETEAAIIWKEVSLLDTNGGKKYEVLKDEKGGAIASIHEGWNDRWFAHIPPGQSQLVWVKFPAPPATVKTITLQLPKMAPFDELTIQD